MLDNLSERNKEYLELTSYSSSKDPLLKSKYKQKRKRFKDEEETYFLQQHDGDR